MNPFAWLASRWGGGQAAAAPAAPVQKAASRRGASGRPAYAAPFNGLSTLPRSQSYQLLAQLYEVIPAMKRSATILSGLSGCPEFLCQTTAATDELNTWARGVPYGYAGYGLGAWLDDMRRQKLIFGFAVGEAEITPGRQVGRLWSYLSPTIDFRPDDTGNFEILQQQPARGMVPLQPETILHVVHDATGCNPRGESQFLAMPSFGNIWADMAHQHHQTWRRSGTPRYHVNAEPLSPEFDDPDGAEGDSVLDGLEGDWNEAMRKTVVDGSVQDYFSWGKITVSTIGADGQVLDIKECKVPIVEEIAVCTDLPPWMLGYSWSTTERLSTQQADMLTARVEHLRREDEGAIRKLVALRQQLLGIRGDFEIVWPDINLQDRRETATASYYEAQAAKIWQSVYFLDWANGFRRQQDVAELQTGSPQVFQEYDGPQSLASGAPDPNTDPNANPTDQQQQNSRTAVELRIREMLAEYPDLWKRAGCNGKH